ncbi:diguanylate cyclase (GGDEF) domain-containing protein [Micromonospora pattaloongensis]|uniref:Diguanylate cyclase (GGDEF) domain-containing protein n=1 Tax=Micromonospora pattaloongensis TaxID=405436 RepID=A0A1H3S5L1_9ACTN|nr:diguanylate cyclase [Micromonospora pattaloongensis]SDZ32791.1 diguanylate cyclase (GGDEF) domain-containing protein [Micromonospora pattaloongensis]
MAGARLAAARPAPQPSEGPRSPARPTLRVLYADPVLRRAALAGVAWLTVFAIYTAINRRLGITGVSPLSVLYLVPIAGAVVCSALAARGSSGHRRLAWWLFCAANVLWLVGEIIFLGYSVAREDAPPTPSIADLYVLQYPVALVAILIGLGPGNVLRQARGTLDAALVAGGTGALGWKLIIGPSVPETFDAGAVVTFAYPVLSVLIVSALLAVGLAGYRTLPLWIMVTGVGQAVSGFSDAQYAYLAVLGEYTESSWLDLGWQAASLLLCLAALIALRHPEPDAELREVDGDVAIVPSLVSAVTVVGLFTADHMDGQHTDTSTLLVAAILCVGLLVRQVMVTRDRTGLAAQLRDALREQERLAVTDALTGVYNRRFFQEMLRLEAERAARHGRPLSLVLVDLDHFKAINDGYGHPAGDAALVQAAERLRRTVRGSDVIARYGGEEFVCLLPGADADAALTVAEQLRRALCDTRVTLGDGVEVLLTASVGVATAGGRGGRTGRGAVDVEALINDADDALYRAKARGRNRTVVAGAVPGLDLDTDPDLPPALVWLADQVDAKLSPEEHSTAVARWALLTGERMGLDHATLRRAAAAGRLHDIGKVNVATPILAKPGRPTEEEWQELRRHPDEGARLLIEFGGRPDLAPLVAAHHERYDGRGYPRGLAGAEIPIEARIIAVCDSWAAMRSHRAYSRGLTVAEARLQIERGRGGQFDPEVADAFLSLVDEGAIDELAPLAPLPPRRPERPASALPRA